MVSHGGFVGASGTIQNSRDKVTGTLGFSPPPQVLSNGQDTLTLRQHTLQP
jgi:hypothetical protein